MYGNLTKDSDPWVAASFPNYEDGSILITLTASPLIKIRLKEASLVNSSAWFKRQIEAIDEERRLKHLGQTDYSFKFIQNPSHNWRFLSLLLIPNVSNLSNITNLVTNKRTQHAEDLLSPPNGSLDQANEVTLVKKQADDEDIKPDIKTLNEETFHLKELLTIGAYRDFLNAVHTHSLHLETSNIQDSLAQIEALVEVASYFEALPAIRIYPSLALTEQPHNLYHAIAQDPVRWLNLSVRLESRAIFSESLIHVVGGFPDMDWPTTCFEAVDETKEIICTKAKELRDWTTEIERELLMNSLEKRRTGAVVTPEDLPGTWLIVSLYRQWVWERIRTSHTTTYRQASFFRQAHKGGDEYLKTNEVKSTIANLPVTTAFRGLDPEKALNILKRTAQALVEPLVKNRLMINAEEAGIPYLTCVNVEEEDLPWKQN